MQSLHETTLEQIDRKNIKLTAFEALQADLNEREISSFIELIWPLPGETLKTFKNGIQTLFERKAGVLIVYSHLLLHNTPLFKKQKEYGLVTRVVRDGASEAHVVVATSDVSNEDFKEGMWFYYIVLALYNTRVLHSLSYYLHESGKLTLTELYSDFIKFCKQNITHHFSSYVHRSIENAQYYDFTNYPMVYHNVLHEHRAEFEELLYEFVSQQNWWKDEKAQALFEIDMLNKAYMYSNSPVKAPVFPLKHTRIIKIEGRNCIIEIPQSHRTSIEYLKINNASENPDDQRVVFKLDHKRVQYPYLEDRPLREKADYCHGIIMRAAKILPVWTEIKSENSTKPSMSKTDSFDQT